MEFQVGGMTCGHCVKAVTEAIQAVDPEAQVQVDLASGRVAVEGTASRESLAEAIAQEGYDVALV